jgi:hypothetical protein
VTELLGGGSLENNMIFFLHNHISIQKQFQKLLMPENRFTADITTSKSPLIFYVHYEADKIEHI